ncbi:universal stress protein [uncultured Maribacter sp.]|uniref:universal stress protein n=1 Tax=uncultured Maribacter sp. TaxID=431308 RepID=UPI0030EE998E|tara:strand:- start:189960 stop:190757 length:798 start_codon:yes stop_codon:yes gene_type:complete
MSNINKILVPFNLSLASERALQYALHFITQNDSPEIITLYASSTSDDDELKEVLQEKISDIKKQFPYASKSNIELIIRKELLIDTILKEQKESNIDLIIMGTKGSDQDEESTFTNTSGLVLEADCPVLVVPEKVEEFQVSRIALVLGKDEIDDPSALGILLETARRFDAQVHVLTICNEDGTYGYSVTDENNENTITYYLEKFYSHHMFMENIDVMDGIFDYVKKKEIDMIAILPSNHSKKNRPSEGRLTKFLTLRSQIPLLTLD